jgi:hypothetical protein
MAIDDPYDAIDQQYPEEEGGPVSALAKVFGTAKDLGLPEVPFVAQFFTFLGSKSPEAKFERGMAFIRQLVDDMQRNEEAIARMRTEISEIRAAINLGLEYDVHEFNDAKRDRYFSAITTAISSKTKVSDLPTFIQDIEKLGERDIIGLKVLNQVMNRPTDWRDTPSPAVFNPPRLHPTTFTHRAADLSREMAHALKGLKATESQAYSREEGLQICYRLQGFGLAEVIEVSPREVPISDYCARLTTRGLMLLRLLGEDVPNWSRYFDANGGL